MKVTGSDFDDTSTTNKVIVIKPHHLLDILIKYILPHGFFIHVTYGSYVVAWRP